MKKVELKVLGLSYSNTHTGSYVLILSELDGNKKIPIIINQPDATWIAMKIEGIDNNRPKVYDVVNKLTDYLGADLSQIYICNIIEGIFYAKLIFTTATDEFEIDCSVSDAVCLALSYSCPIMCSQNVLTIAGIEIDEDGRVTDEQDKINKSASRDYKSTTTVENLETMLSNAIENEEYEIASQLRDRIKELKKETR